MSPNVKSDKSAPYVYADHAATTPLDEAVYECMRPYFSGTYGNPSSLHTSGRRACKVLVDAREKIAHLLEARPEEIIFTGSGTESDNLAIVGTARANRAHGNHIIVSSIEHKAVLESARALIKEGFEVTEIPVDKSGMVDARDVVGAIKDTTILISIMLGNNEIGTLLPVQEIAKEVKKIRGDSPTPLMHTDACQAAGFEDIAPTKLGVDLLSLNGSKIYGPKGVGVLYKKKDTKIESIIVGGAQEYHLRAGTESVPLIVGITEAYAHAVALREQEVVRLEKLRAYFIEGLTKAIPDILINGNQKHHLPHITHVTVPLVEGESLVLLLDAHGIETSTGSACSSHDLRPSYVLTAIGQDDELVHGSVRFSFGRHTTKEDIDYILSVFPPIVATLKGISATNTYVGST